MFSENPVVMGRSIIGHCQIRPIIPHIFAPSWHVNFIYQFIVSNILYFIPPFDTSFLTHSLSPSSTLHPFPFLSSHSSAGWMSGVVRMEQKNSSLWEENIFDDGPYEVGDEGQLDPDLVPVPANSYLGESIITWHSIHHHPYHSILAPSCDSVSLKNSGVFRMMYTRFQDARHINRLLLIHFRSGWLFVLYLVQILFV